MKQGIDFRFLLKLDQFELNVQASIPGQGVTGLFGRSGCGKTSLLRCIAGLSRPSDAFLSVNGNRWQESASGLFLPPHRRSVGYVFQQGLLFPHLKVRKNLEYGLRRSPPGGQREGFDRVVEILGLGDLLDRSTLRLSGGEKQRVAIGRALLNNPQLLLMDEPMAALDRAHKKEILPYLERLHEAARIPVIYVTHDLDELVHIADHLMLMDKGRLPAAGPLDEMLIRLDLPTTRDSNAGAVIDTRILSHDDEFHLTQLGFPGGELTVGWLDKPVGNEIRIRIHAKDISLVLEPPGPTSILNILPAQVIDTAIHGRGRVMIALDVAGTRLLARITRKSQVKLGLEPGMKVYAQIKSVALSL